MKKGQHLFCLNFKEHIRSFIRAHELTHPNKKIVISVSGGVDSMVLADVLKSFERDVELLHFNHGTRPKENAREEKLIRNFAEKNNLPLHVFHFDLNLKQKNFEQVARQKRKEIFEKFLNQKDAWIYTAHHIDDSFEWTLMQTFKQAGVKSTLGIPVFSNGIVRPLMCVTKKHILKYAHAKGLFWIEDSSNQNTKFERNDLRLSVTGKILERYPKALRHYVSRHNQLALMQNVHRKKMHSDLVILKEESGSCLFISNDLKNHKNEIKDAIHAKSESARGEIDVELDKLLSAHKIIMEDPKNYPFKGPMTFSGGVTAFLVRNTLVIIGASEMAYYKTLDHTLQRFLALQTQIPHRAFSLPFPQIIIGSQKLPKTSKVIHPLLPVTCTWLKEQGISYGFAPLLSNKDRQMLVNDALILDSSVMGL